MSADRILPPIKFTATLRGVIHRVLEAAAHDEPGTDRKLRALYWEWLRDNQEGRVEPCDHTGCNVDVRFHRALHAAVTAQHRRYTRATLKLAAEAVP